MKTKGVDRIKYQWCNDTKVHYSQLCNGRLPGMDPRDWALVQALKLCACMTLVCCKISLRFNFLICKWKAAIVLSGKFSSKIFYLFKVSPLFSVVNIHKYYKVLFLLVKYDFICFKQLGYKSYLIWHKRDFMLETAPTTGNWYLVSEWSSDQNLNILRLCCFLLT